MAKIDFNAPGMVDEGGAKAPPVNTAAQTLQKPLSAPDAKTADAPEDASFGAAAKDLALGAASGVEQAVRGVRQVGKMITGDTEPLPPPLIEEPKALPAKILSSVVQFGLGWGVGGMALKGVGLAAKLGTVGTNIAAQGIGTGLVADAHAPNLSNIMQQFPFTQGPIQDFLASKPDDSIAMGKFKAAIQDMGLQAAGSLLYKIVVGTKAAQAGNTKLAEQMQKEVVEDATKASASPEASASATLSHVSTLTDPRADLIKAMPGGKLSDEIKQVPISELKGGHEINTPGGAASVEKWTKQFQEDASKVPAFIREEHPDGTYSILNGNGRLNAAQKLGYTHVSVQDYQGAETLAAKTGQAVEGAATKEAVAKAANPATELHVANDMGKPLFSLTAEHRQAFQDQVGAMVRSGNNEDVVRSLSSMMNHENMDSPHDVQKVVQAISAWAKPELDKQGLRQMEVMTNEQTKQAADLLGMDVNAYLAKARPMAQSANDMPSVIATGNALIQSFADQMSSLAGRVYIGGDEAAVGQLAKLTSVFEDVFGTHAALRTGMARGTQAGNIRTGVVPSQADAIMEAIQKAGGAENVRQIAQRISMAGTDRKAVLRTLQASMGRKLLDAHNEFWINGILSGIKTHVVNMTSNTVKTLVTPFNQIIGGTIRRDWADVKEGVALYRGLRTHFFDSLSMAARAFKNETAILDPGKGTYEYYNRAISSSYFNLKEDTWFGQGVDFLGKVIRFPGRFLTAEDEFFKQMGYRAKTMADAGRESEALVAAGKLDRNKMVDMMIDGKTHQVSEVEKYVQDRFQSAFNPNGAAADKTALNYAREVTFNQDLNIPTRGGGMSIGASLQRVAASHPLLRGTILPFVKVPTNIMRDFVDHSLLAPLTQRFKNDIAAGGTRASLAMGKLSTGTMLSAAATMLAMEGRFTGAAPGDKDMQARWKESGKQPYSLVLGDLSDPKSLSYISLQRIDPWGMMFGLAADFHQTAEHLDGDSRHNFAAALALAVANNLESKSYLQGIVEFTSMFGSGYDKEANMERLVQRRVASYIPAYANLYTGNEEMKQLRTWYDGALAKIPGWSGTVEAKRDYLTGEKRLAPDGYPWNAINPFTVSNSKGDAVRDELARLSQSQAEAKFSLPDSKLGSIDLSTVRNDKGQSAFDRWTELIGQMKHGGMTFAERLKSTIDSERYKKGTDGTSYYGIGSRVAQVKAVHEIYKMTAQQQMLKEFQNAHTDDGVPVNLRTALRDDKVNTRAMKAGRVDRMKDISNLQQ